jgi:Flp pilus assembly protein TadG
MRYIQTKRKIQGERSQSVMELALILPILLMLVLEISEFGRAWMTLNLITGAVREGARLASVTLEEAERLALPKASRRFVSRQFGEWNVRRCFSITLRS